MSQLDALASDYASLSAIQATQVSLRQARARLDTLHRVCKQLEPLAASSAEEAKGKVVQVPLAPKAFLQARTTGAQVRVVVPSKPTESEGKGKEKEVREEKVDVKTALEMLGLRKKGVEMELTLLRRKLDALLRTATGAEAVDQPATPSTSGASSSSAASAKQALTTLEALTQDEGGTEVDAQGRVLNEEGLPFVDVVEPATEEETAATASAAARAAAATAATVKATQAEQSMSAEERQRWMADVFAKLAMEEEAELNAASDEEAPSTSKPAVAVAPSTPSRASAPSPSPPSTPIIHSSARPAPRRSALKRTHSNASSTTSTTASSAAAAAIPPPMALARTPPNFGAAGVRRGFLNLNPSSPAAERSSDPIAAAGAALASAAASASPSRVAALHAREGSTDASADEEEDLQRMSRSEELPSAAGGKKKQVRIMSPARTRSRSPPRRRFARGGRPIAPNWQGASNSAGASSSSATANSNLIGGIKETLPREQEDVGVEEEARRILELLGPAVVRGHPNAPKDLDALQRAKEDDDRARLAALQPQAQQEEAPRRTPKKPVMNQTVVERTPFNAQPQPPLPSSPQATATAAKPTSGFKRGFLNRAAAGPPKSSLARAAAAAAAAAASSSSSTPPPLPSTTKLPAAPRTSQGISALERSLRFEEATAASATAAGAEEAPQPLPHARPSKAFAARLEARKKGVAAAAEEHKEEEETGEEREGRGVRFAESVVRGGTESKGKGKGVAFAEPASKSANAQKEEEEDGGEAPHLIGDAMGFVDSQPRVDIGGDLSDEERRPYASGSSNNSDEDEEDADSLQWASEDSLDLDELTPSFSALASDFESAELAREYELAKAGLEEARQRAAMSMLGGAVEDEDEGDEEEEDGFVPLDHGVEEEGAKRESRFKASRVVRAAGYEKPRSKQLSTPGSSSKVNGKAKATASYEEEEDGVDEATRRADEAGHELAHLLESAQNVGPQGASSSSSSSTTQANLNNRDVDGLGVGAGLEGVRPVMVIPSLAPVRYPRNARQLLSGDTSSSTPVRAPGPVALEEDETQDYEEEREEALMGVMRARLAARDERENARLAEGNDGKVKREEKMEGPPVVSAVVREGKKKEEEKETQVETASATAAAQPPKKVSRFKAARQQVQ